MQDNLFVISYIALWVLLVLLYAAVVLLYAHFGELLRQAQNQVGAGPSIAMKLDLTLSTVDGATYRLSPASGRPHIVIFAAPNCSHCRRVQPTVRELAMSNRSIGFVVVYSGDVSSTRAYADAISQSIIAVSDPNRELARMWKVREVPYAVVADTYGIIRRKGIVGKTEALKSFVKQAAEGYPVQDVGSAK